MKRIISLLIITTAVAFSYAQKNVYMWSDGKFSSHSMDSIAFVSVPSAVDLGLSVMWANMDLNAGKDTESGAFYSWGEITPKAEYTEENYKFGKAGSMTKYNESDSEIGVSRILDPEDDAATQVLGGKWRMPTIEEWQELITKCKWTWKTRFWIVTGPSGKSIRIMASNHDQDNNPDGRKATDVSHTADSIPPGTKALTQMPDKFQSLQSDGEGILVSQLANGKSRYVMLLNRSIDNTQNITFYLGESVKRITPFNGEEKLNAGRQTVTLTPGNYAIYKIK